jgi:DNA repair ATPase RecN
MISVEEIRKLLANSQESINMTSAEEIREFLKSLQESIEDEVYSGDLEKIDKIVEDLKSKGNRFTNIANQINEVRIHLSEAYGRFEEILSNLSDAINMDNENLLDPDISF